MRSRALASLIVVACLAPFLSGCNAAIIAGIILGTTGKSSSRGGVLIPPAVSSQTQPTINAVSPASGIDAGGNTITISGSSFDGDATVSIGGVQATQVAVPDAQTITAIVPPHVGVGAVDVVVTNARGGSATLANGYVYLATPSVVTIAPIPSPQSGNIVFSFTLADAGSDAANVSIEIDAGSGFQPIPRSQIVSGDVAGLATSPTGVVHSVAFDSQRAFPARNVASVRVRVTAVGDGDKTAGTPGISNAFDIENKEAVDFAVAQPLKGSYRVAISYRLSADEIAGGLWVSGLTWAEPATGRSGPLTVSSGQGVDIIRSVGPNGSVLTVWDSDADVGLGNNHVVTVSVTITDGFTSRTATTQPFVVSNGPLSDPRPLSSLEVIYGIALGDVTGGGFPDLVAGDGLNGVQVFQNRGRNFGRATIQATPPIPDPSPPFPGPSGFLSPHGYVAQAAILDVNGDGALDAVLPDVVAGAIGSLNLSSVLASVNADASSRYAHVLAHQATLTCRQGPRGLNVAGGSWQSAIASIGSRAPHVFVSGGSLFAPTPTGDPALDNVGWLNQQVVAADLDGPLAQGHGSRDLVLLDAISQLGRANGGDARGCVVIRQVDPTTRTLGAPVYLDPTDMGALPTSIAIGDVLSSSRTSATFTSAPLGATAALGAPDVVVANTGDASLTFYLQLAPATWQSGAYTPPTFTSVKLDLASIVPGTGPGDITGVAIGDLDGDGKNDLVVVGAFTRTLTIFVYDPDPSAAGSLLPATHGLVPLRKSVVLDTGALGAGRPLLARISSGSKLDIVLPFSLVPRLGVYVNTSTAPGAPAFDPVVYPFPDVVVAAAVADLRGDGRDGVVALGGQSAFALYETTEGTLDENFTAVATGSVPERLTVADALSTGAPQIVCPCRGDGSVTVFARDPWALLAPAARYDLSRAGGLQFFAPNETVVADATGGGKNDLVAVSTNAVSGGQLTGAFALLRGPLGASSTVAAVESAIGVRALGVAVGDLDEDGRPDVVVGAFSGVLIFKSDGAGGFTSRTVLPGAIAPAVAVADLDGDGHLDLVVAVNGQIVVFWNGGDRPGTPGFLGWGKFAATPAVVSAIDDATCLVVRDLDGDGRNDIVASHELDGLAFVVFQTSPRVFVDVPLYTRGRPGQIAVGDLNGDGRLDLAITWGADALVAVYQQNPKRTGPADTFLVPVTYTTLGSPKGCAIIDVDGDGKNDLVVASETTNTLNVFIQR